MQLDTEEKIARLSYMGMQVVHSLSEDEPPRVVQQTVLDAFGKCEFFYFVNGLRTVSRLCACRVSSSIWAVFSAGVNRFTALRFVSGFESQSAMRRAGGVNSESKNDVNEFLAPFFRSVCPPTANVMLFGHSGGGVLVEAAATMLRDFGRPAPLSIITYGAPKAYLAGSSNDADETFRRRWMLERDPVPGFPYYFRPDGSWSRMVQSTIQSVGLSADFPVDLIRHGPGGVILESEGSASVAADTSSCTEADFDNFLDWAIEGGSIPARQHTTGQYLNALRRRASFPLGSSEYDLGGRRPTSLPYREVYEPGTVVPGNEEGPMTTLNQRHGLLRVSRGDTEVPANREVDAMPQSKVTSDMRFSVQNITGTFCVIFQGLVVATCERPSQARTIARAGNRLCRTLGLALTIDANLWDDAWSEYGGKASTPGNGVTPAQPWQ